MGDMRGVERPDGLGMRTGAQIRSRADAAKVAERIGRQMEEDARTIERLRADAERLWNALRVVSEAVVVLDQEVDGYEKPAEVEQAITVLADLAVYGNAPEARPCPECMQGKHTNCDGQSMTDDGVMTECPCYAAGHESE